MNNLYKELTSDSVVKYFLIAACLVIILAGIKAAANIINLVLLALLISLSIYPFQRGLRKRGIPPVIAVIITIFFVILVGLVIVFLLYRTGVELTYRLPDYRDKFIGLTETIKTYLGQHRINLPEMPANFDEAQLLNILGKILGILTQGLGNSLVIIFLVVLFLVEYAYLGNRMEQPGEKDSPLVNRFSIIATDLIKYVSITGWAGLLSAVGIVVLLTILKVDFALTWGVLYFFLNYIPNIGFFISIIPPTLLAILDRGWVIAVVVIIGYTLCNLFGETILKPRYFKKDFDLSLLWVILSLIFWGWILGAPGTILAVPMTLTIRKFILSNKPTPL